MARTTPPEGAVARLPEPGIYEMIGTRRGEHCLIAYDADGEFEVASGVGAYHHLESWLEDRGVRLDSPRPALFLI